MNKKIVNNRTELSSDNGYIHKIGTDIYFKKGFILDDINNYEEVDKRPNYTKTDYNNKVAELIRTKYTESQEFAIQRKAINSLLLPSTHTLNEDDLKEYTDYNTFIEDCKNKARKELEQIKQDID